MVHGRALTKATELRVFGLELGDMAPAAIHGLGIPRLLGTRHHVVQECAHAGVSLVVAIDHVACLGHRDVQRLRQTVGLLAVHDAKVHGLGAAAQVGRYLGYLDAKYARGRLGMEVLALVKGAHQVLVTRKMREQAQLDLRVVHRQKDAPLARRKRRLDGTTQLRARRNVLQIGVARRQTARRRNGLVVRGVHATIAATQRTQRVQIGRLDLGLLTPVQDQAHNLVVTGKVGQHLGVGRIIAALGLFEALGRKPHHIKEHVRQLHGATDIKGLVAGQVANAALDLGNLGCEALGQIVQTIGVNEHTRALHLGKHRHERHLDAVEHVGGVLARHAVAQRGHQGQRQGSRTSSGYGRVLAGTFRAAGRRQ